MEDAGVTWMLCCVVGSLVLARLSLVNHNPCCYVRASRSLFCYVGHFVYVSNWSKSKWFKNLLSFLLPGLIHRCTPPPTDPLTSIHPSVLLGLQSTSQEADTPKATCVSLSQVIFLSLPVVKSGALSSVCPFWGFSPFSSLQLSLSSDVNMAAALLGF